MSKVARSGFMGLGVLFVLAHSAQAQEALPITTAGAADGGSSTASLPQARQRVDRMVLLYSGAKYYGSVEEEIAGSHVVLKLATGESKRFPAQEVLKIAPLESAGIPSAEGASELQRFVTLTDGTSLSGEFVEYIPSDHVTLLLASGEVRRIELTQIRQIRRRPSDPALEAPKEPAPRSPLAEWNAAQRRRALYEIKAGKVMLPLGTAMMMLGAATASTGPAVDALGLAVIVMPVLGASVHLAGIGTIATGSIRLRQLDRGSSPEKMTATGRWILTRGGIITGVGLGVSLLSLSAFAFKGPSASAGAGPVVAITTGLGAPLLVVGVYMMGIGRALKSDLGSSQTFAWSLSPYLGPQSVGLTWSLVHK